MVYRMTVKSNPRLILSWLLILGAPLIGLILLLKVGSAIGIIALIGAGILSYHTFQYTVAHMKHLITTSDEDILCELSPQNIIRLPWHKISHAGFCSQKGGKPFIFLYSEAEDQLLTIPKEFSNFEVLEEEIRKRTDFQETRLSKNETINDWLKERLPEEQN